ncbi:hypothetical protein PLICRDRAFT_304026 [Plicaturopsis crispa FD-325 SS-3]|nr:hypothetical protein PLICRDRAFT_304026 [Plicaturopsis crispa FD-325 SS-3]
MSDSVDPEVLLSDIIDITTPSEDPSAYVILRTADHADIRALKSFLSFGSAFFASMFQLPQAPTRPSSADVRDGSAVVKVTESKETMLLLVKMLYPAWVDLPEIGLVMKTLDAAGKYGMDGVEGRMRSQIMSTSAAMVVSNPLRLYALAQHFKMDKEIREAAKEMLSRPLSEEATPAELTYVSAACLHRYFRYHAKCGKAASGVIQNYAAKDFFLPQDRVGSHSCKPVLEVWPGSFVSPWTIRYFDAIRAALLNQPSASTLSKPHLVNDYLKSSSSCEGCEKNLRATVKQIEKFKAKMAPEIDRAIAKPPF